MKNQNNTFYELLKLFFLTKRHHVVGKQENYANLVANFKVRVQA